MSCVLVSGKPCVAVIREEGSNGDREMSAALFMAGFEVFNLYHYKKEICIIYFDPLSFLICRCGMSQCRTCVQARRPLTPSELWSLLVDSAMQMC